MSAGQEHVLQQEDGKPRFVQIVTDLSRAFALCAATDEAIAIRDDISFFQAIKAALAKPSSERKSPDELDHAVRQLVSKAIVAGGFILSKATGAGGRRWYRTYTNAPDLAFYYGTTNSVHRCVRAV